MLKVRTIVASLAVVAAFLSAWSAPPKHPQAEPRQQQPQTEQRGSASAPLFVQGEVTTKKDKGEAAKDEEDRISKEAADADLVKYTGGLFIATGSLAIGTALLAFFTWRLSRSTSNLVKETVKGGREVERAYVFTEFTFQGNFDLFKATDKFVVEMHFWNYGKTPAVVKKIRADVGIYESPPTSLDHAIEFELPPALGIAQNVSHSVQRIARYSGDEEWQAVRLRHKHIYCFGCMTYSDVFGDPHETGFCWQFDIGKRAKTFVPTQSELNYRN